MRIALWITAAICWLSVAGLVVAATLTYFLKIPVLSMLEAMDLWNPIFRVSIMSFAFWTGVNLLRLGSDS